MSTHLSSFVEQVDTKWQEVDLLISEAIIKDADGEQELYNALCRSLTVLMVAHFEGFSKDLVKAVVSDLNHNCEFADLPPAVKITFCKKYYGNREEEVNNNLKGIGLLKETFEDLNCNISHEPFFYPINKNPNVKTIQKVFHNFGVQKVFSYLHDSELSNAAFTESITAIKDALDRIKISVVKGIEDFPYNFNIDEFNLKYTEFSKKTLWEEFIDDINQKRHDVAHGNNFLNAVDINEIIKSKNKIMLLEFALVGILSNYITQTIT